MLTSVGGFTPHLLESCKCRGRRDKERLSISSLLPGLQYLLSGPRLALGQTNAAAEAGVLAVHTDRCSPHVGHRALEESEVLMQSIALRRMRVRKAVWGSRYPRSDQWSGMRNIVERRGLPHLVLQGSKTKYRAFSKKRKKRIKDRTITKSPEDYSYDEML